MKKLVECKDCGQMMSKRASACPACGAPAKKRTSPVTKLLAVILLGPMVIFMVFAIVNPNQIATQSVRNASEPADRREFSSNREMFLADKGRALAWQAEDVDSIRNILKDADSAEFKAVFTSFYSDSPVTCGEVNAKNSLGGYAGFKRFIAARSAGIRVVRGDGQMRDSEFDKVWGSACQDPLSI